jgi:hypothetical protein
MVYKHLTQIVKFWKFCLPIKEDFMILKFIISDKKMDKDEIMAKSHISLEHIIFFNRLMNTNFILQKIMIKI